jgi:hypothetical protein
MSASIKFEQRSRFDPHQRLHKPVAKKFNRNTAGLLHPRQSRSVVRVHPRVPVWSCPARYRKVGVYSRPHPQGREATAVSRSGPQPSEYCQRQPFGGGFLGPLPAGLLEIGLLKLSVAVRAHRDSPTIIFIVIESAGPRTTGDAAVQGCTRGSSRELFSRVRLLRFFGGVGRHRECGQRDGGTDNCGYNFMHLASSM